MKNTFYAIFLFVVSVFFFSCTDSNDNANNTGRLVVQLTDAPFPYDLITEANVTVFKIDARYKGDAYSDDMDSKMMDDDDDVKDEDGSRFITLMEEDVAVNLLDLTNGVTENLVDIDVPTGTYDLVRVYVKGVNVVLTDGTTYDLKVPSGEQTGIKVFIKPGIVVAGGLTADLLLDFDVSKSFVVKGNAKDLAGINGFNFKPVIKASNMSTSGTLSGVVTTMQEELAVGLEGAEIAVFAADTLNTTTFTDLDGNYMVMGLKAGVYAIQVEAEGYAIEIAEGVEIIAANKTIKDFELNPLTE